MEASDKSAGIRVRDYTPDDHEAVLQFIRELQYAGRAFDPRPHRRL